MWSISYLFLSNESSFSTDCNDLCLTPTPLNILTLQNVHWARQPLLDKTVPIFTFFLNADQDPIVPYFEYSSTLIKS